MFLLLASFLAGVLTSLAPCVLPLLPVIVGSSILRDSGEAKQDHRKPYIITISLVVSVIAFTLLLKVSSALIGIDPKVWTVIAGGIVALLGISMLLPNLWARISSKLGFEQGSNKLLDRAADRSGTFGAILTGAALGPVFSSCSPVYALVLATVLPTSVALGMVYIFAYAVGLGLALLAIALLGRRLTAKLSWAINPDGWFRKVLAIILIIVGLMVITGYDQKFQTWAADHLPFDISSIEEKLVTTDSDKQTKDNGDNTVFNVDPYPAPELVGTGEWFNSQPLTLEELSGKVVLIDFWTYSCINCIRTLPYLQQWYETYQDEGFVIIGVHAPEFAFEKVAKNVQDAIDEHGLTYPIVQDNDFMTWQAYNNRFWPAHYLIDKDGNVRREHFGEGEYEDTEQAIRLLLAESGHATSDPFTIKGSTAPPISSNQTPETYLGYERGERFAGAAEYQADQIVDYTLKDKLTSGQWSLGGKWTIGATQTTSDASGAVLRIKFSAKEVYLVMEGDGSLASLKLNGDPVTADNFGGDDVDRDGHIKVDEPRLYKLIKSPDFIEDGVLDITLPEGVVVNAFTFGS